MLDFPFKDGFQSRLFRWCTDMQISFEELSLKTSVHQKDRTTVITIEIIIHISVRFIITAVRWQCIKDPTLTIFQFPFSHFYMICG